MDQRAIRPDPAPRDLDEFIAFLADLERVFGPVEKPARARRDVIFRL